jgi:hypothetical protein
MTDTAEDTCMHNLAPFRRNGAFYCPFSTNRVVIASAGRRSVVMKMTDFSRLGIGTPTLRITGLYMFRRFDIQKFYVFLQPDKIVRK